MQTKISIAFQLNFEGKFIELGRANFSFKSPHSTNFIGATTLNWWYLPGVGLVLVRHPLQILRLIHFLVHSRLVRGYENFYLFVHLLFYLLLRHHQSFIISFRSCMYVSSQVFLGFLGRYI